MSLIQSYWSLENKTPVVLQSAAPLITAVGALALTSSVKSVTAVPILGVAALLSTWLFRTLVTQTQTLTVQANEKKKSSDNRADLEGKCKDLEARCKTLEGQIPDNDAKARVESEVQKQQELKQLLTQDNQDLLGQVQAAERKLKEAANTVIQSPITAFPETSPQSSSLTAPELFFWTKFRIAKEGNNPGLEEQLSQWTAAETSLKDALEGTIPAAMTIPFDELPLAYQVACDNQLKALADRFASEMVAKVGENLQAVYKEAIKDVVSWDVFKGSYALNHLPLEILPKILEKVTKPLMLIGLQRDNEEYFKTGEGAALKCRSWKQLCLKDRCSNDKSSLARLVAKVGIDASWEDRYFYDVAYSPRGKDDILLSIRGSQIQRLSFFDVNAEKLDLVLQRCPSLKSCSLSREFEPSMANWEALAAMSTLQTLEFWFEPKELVQGLKKFKTLPMLIFHNRINFQQFAEQGIVLKKLGCPVYFIKDPAASELADIEDLFCESVNLYRHSALVKSLADLKKLKRLRIHLDSYSSYKPNLEQFFLEKGITLEWCSLGGW
jgi:hypothetical protein